MVRLKNSCGIILSIMLMVSCQSLDMSNGFKQRHLPGVPHAKEYIMYSFQFKSSREITITGIDIRSKNNTQTIEQYAIIDSENNLGQTVTESRVAIDSGNYQITFRKDAGFNVRESIILSYEVNGMKMSKKLKIESKEKIKTHR